MLSIINKKEALSSIFSATNGLCEVYSDVDYSFEHEICNFTIYGKDVDVTLLLFRLNFILNEKVHLYSTEDAMSTALSGKKIIWREGRWYV